MGKMYYQNRNGDIVVVENGDWNKAKTLTEAVEEDIKKDSDTLFKTINGESIVGEGNIDISGGDGKVNDVKVNGTSVLKDKVANIKVKTINKQDITGEGNIEVLQSYSLQLEFQQPVDGRAVYPLTDEIWTDIWDKKPILINLTFTMQGMEIASMDFLRTAVAADGTQETMGYYSIVTLPEYKQKIVIQITNNDGTKVLIFEQESLDEDDIRNAQLFESDPTTNVFGTYSKKIRNDIIWVQIVLRNNSESDFTFTKGTNYKLNDYNTHAAPITVMSANTKSSVVGHFRFDSSYLCPLEDVTLPARSFVTGELTYIK